MESPAWKELATEWLRWTFAIAVCLSPLITLLLLAYTTPGHWIEMHVMQPFYVWEDRFWSRIGNLFDRFKFSFLVALGGLLVLIWLLQEVKQRGR